MSRRLALLLLIGLFTAPLLPAQDTFQNVPRIVAVGDVHGDFAALTEVLQAAKIIDADLKWIGGKAHLVQTGDVPDRGSDTRKALDLLMDLEKQASKAGGRVHALIGNHEAMNVYGDLRYVSPGEYESFRTKDSEKLRQRAYDVHFQDPPKPTEEERQKWFAERPLGWVEHRDAFGATGKYGRWIVSHNAIVKVNDSVFLHGGISPKYAAKSIRDLNKQIREELTDYSKLHGGVAMDQEGPLWFRGLAVAPEPEFAKHVDAVLAAYGVKRIVMGHTPQPGITSRFGGKVILIDVGLSKVYGGRRACLVIENGEAKALTNGKLSDLP